MSDGCASSRPTIADATSRQRADFFNGISAITTSSIFAAMSAFRKWRD